MNQISIYENWLQIISNMNSNQQSQQNRFNQFEQPKSINQSANLLLAGIDELTKAIRAVKAENVALQLTHNQSTIHLMQLQEDTEMMLAIHKKLKTEFDKLNELNPYANDQEQTRNQVATTQQQSLITQSQPQWEVYPPNYKANIKLRYALHTESVVCSVCFNSNSDCLAFSDNRTIYVISTQDLSVITTFEIPIQNACDFNARVIRISPDSQYLAIGGPMHNVLIYSIPSRKMIGNLLGHENKISTLLFSNDSSTLYSGGFDGYICIWKLKTMSLVNRIKHGSEETMKNGSHMIVSLTKDDEESFIAVGFMNGTVGIYDPTFTQPMNSFKAHEQFLLDVSTSPLDCSIATSSHDTTTKIWSLRGVASCRKVLQGHSDFVLSTCFSPKETICFTGSKDETIKAWDYKKGELIFTLKAHTNTLFELQHHPTEKMFASCSGDGLVCLWTYSL
ncbi:Transcriptional repressor tup12-related protein [Tritrichomonas foetus]|uniref:Transcriptional repressor tup12-related protein n=1 Tax=Tritrichomonas foetus TaxID=1144522 RepID=A0A1J4J2A3_9EUKA|nr:Transcriptional repressor tup12-related protein [Tritrichomonas foetus]|eukprot:OHS93506.1 Transcriptional repressor tup12-related protein [Tritrichomonas foetus]